MMEWLQWNPKHRQQISTIILLHCSINSSNKDVFSTNKSSKTIFYHFNQLSNDLSLASDQQPPQPGYLDSLVLKQALENKHSLKLTLLSETVDHISQKRIWENNLIKSLKRKLLLRDSWVIAKQWENSTLKIMCNKLHQNHLNYISLEQLIRRNGSIKSRSMWRD